MIADGVMRHPSESWGPLCLRSALTPDGCQPSLACRLALARLEAAVGLVDDVGAAPTADHAAVAGGRLEGVQGIADLHGSERLPVVSNYLLEKRGAALGGRGAQVKLAGQRSDVATS